MHCHLGLLGLAFTEKLGKLACAGAWGCRAETATVARVVYMGLGIPTTCTDIPFILLNLYRTDKALLRKVKVFCDWCSASCVLWFHKNIKHWFLFTQKNGEWAGFHFHRWCWRLEIFWRRAGCEEGMERPTITPHLGSLQLVQPCLLHSIEQQVNKAPGLKKKKWKEQVIYFFMLKAIGLHAEGWDVI